MRARDAAGSRPLITVITVVFNNRDGFAGTAASVCEQKDASFEWVVIDGGSTDGTVDLIKAHAEHMAFWVSERDSGIYDAMNKGLANAKGEFCVFMNSGDRFAGSDTLHKVAEAIEESPPGIGMLLGAARTVAKLSVCAKAASNDALCHAQRADIAPGDVFPNGASQAGALRSGHPHRRRL